MATDAAVQKHQVWIPEEKIDLPPPQSTCQPLSVCYCMQTEHLRRKNQREIKVQSKPEYLFHRIPELNSSSRHVGGSSKGWGKDNKPVKGRPLPTLCFAYYSKLASTATDFSNDVANLSAADLEDIREAIEKLSNLAFDYSIIGDLMSPNPNICNHSRALRVSEDLKRPGVFSWQ